MTMNTQFAKLLDPWTITPYPLLFCDDCNAIIIGIGEDEQPGWDNHLLTHTADHLLQDTNQIHNPWVCPKCGFGYVWSSDTDHKVRRVTLDTINGTCKYV